TTVIYSKNYLMDNIENNSNNSSFEKQELAKFFKEFGITENINNNLELLSNTNKNPNTKLMDNFLNNILNSNNSDNLKNIINNLDKVNSNNTTVIYSKNYLMDNIENNSSDNNKNRSHITNNLKKLTWPELSKIVYDIEKELESNISNDSNFGYINNYFAVSKNKFSGRDLLNKSDKICPVGYKLANFNSGINTGKYNLEALGLYFTKNYDIYDLVYDKTIGYKRLSLYGFMEPKVFLELKSVIKNKNIYSNLGINGIYVEFFSKYGLENSSKNLNKKYNYNFINNEYISIGKESFTICKKNNSKDNDKIPGNLKMIKKNNYDYSGVKKYENLGFFAAFNSIEYDYFNAYDNGIEYTYYEPVIDENGNFIFFYEENIKK
ncbi:MAG: hypothetical protein NWP80_00670, partial [Candidatus Gracilibacteria bacterium]|nr:hypothetical protein [Candidatus Gracilibacteria bacterium]